MRVYYWLLQINNFLHIVLAFIARILCKWVARITSLLYSRTANKNEFSSIFQTCAVCVRKQFTQYSPRCVDFLLARDVRKTSERNWTRSFKSRRIKHIWNIERSVCLYTIVRHVMGLAVMMMCAHHDHHICSRLKVSIQIVCPNNKSSKC